MDNTLLHTKILLIVSWIAILFNMVFADIFSIILELTQGDTIELFGDPVSIMAMAALITNIPILMILFTWILPDKKNALSNIVAALLGIVYVIGGGSLKPHYVIMASIEVFLMINIIIISIRWRRRLNLISQS